MPGRDEFASNRGKRRLDLDIEIVLATLSAHYMFDGEGRIVGRRRSVAGVDGETVDGLCPRFVLGRAAEGCVWRIRSDVASECVTALSRLAAREPGAGFDGDLPAPPERIAAIGRVLGAGDPWDAMGPSTAKSAKAIAPRRERITRDGVTVGEIWIFD